MLVTLAGAVYVLAVLVPALTVFVAVRGFDTPSIVERYIEHAAERRRRLYTTARRRHRVLV